MNSLPRCAQSGCTGQIEDGFCDVCGAPPAAAATAGPAPAVPTGLVPARHTAPASAGGSLMRGTLGAGLVEIPPVVAHDPAWALLDDPEVPENKRYCGSCDAPVGRGQDGIPGRTDGYCAKCGVWYSFVPRLEPGDLVADQYEVAGCLAHGGTGWVYLARDRGVSDRWVALKGVLGSADPDLLAASIAERGHLARVEHPNIVRIYNVVQHAGADYIVMEYVGGRSLKDITLGHRQAGESPPLPHVLAYTLEALRALGHLHGRGLLYCDFKPANAIHSGERLRLIDLGGVRRIDDHASPVFGTVGFQAPEIADLGPTVSSDLYTVGRTMAVLSFEFTGFTGEYKYTLPDRADISVLRWNESFDRLLRRATHHDPARRFGTAAEMAEQVAGVLREVLAAGDGRARPAPSHHFTPVAPVAATGPARLPGAYDSVEALPVPLPDTLPEPKLRDAADKLLAGDTRDVASLLGDGDFDWRVEWLRGICALREGKVRTARERFTAVYDLLPGESAPKLALGLCAELAGDQEAAARYHRMAWRTDRAYLTSAFGLARALFARGERARAVRVLDSVPLASSHRTEARIAAIVAMVAGRSAADLTYEELVAAAERLEELPLDDARNRRLTILVLDAALEALRARRVPASGDRILGVALSERALRGALERNYRELARTADRDDRAALVEQANLVRPMTLI